MKSIKVTLLLLLTILAFALSRRSRRSKTSSQSHKSLSRLLRTTSIDYAEFLRTNEIDEAKKHHFEQIMHTAAKTCKSWCLVFKHLYWVLGGDHALCECLTTFGVSKHGETKESWKTLAQLNVPVAKVKEIVASEKCIKIG